MRQGNRAQEVLDPLRRLPVADEEKLVRRRAPSGDPDPNKSTGTALGSTAILAACAGNRSPQLAGEHLADRQHGVSFREGTFVARPQRRHGHDPLDERRVLGDHERPAQALRQRDRARAVGVDRVGVDDAPRRSCVRLPAVREGSQDALALDGGMLGPGRARLPLSDREPRHR